MVKPAHLAVAREPAQPPIVADTGPEQWWCTCADADGPHVHTPWGGMHIELVDIELPQVRTMRHVLEYITHLTCGNAAKSPAGSGRLRAARTKSPPPNDRNGVTL